MERHVDTLQRYGGATSAKCDRRSGLLDGGEVAVDQGGEIFVANGLGVCVAAEIITNLLENLVGLKLCVFSISIVLVSVGSENGLHDLHRHIAAE